MANLRANWNVLFVASFLHETGCMIIFMIEKYPFLQERKLALMKNRNGCKMKPETDLVVIGALGLVKNTLRKYTSSIPGDVNIRKVQQILLTMYTFTRGCYLSSKVRDRPPHRATGSFGHNCKDWQWESFHSLYSVQLKIHSHWLRGSNSGYIEMNVTGSSSKDECVLAQPLKL